VSNDEEMEEEERSEAARKGLRGPLAHSTQVSERQGPAGLTNTPPAHAPAAAAVWSEDDGVPVRCRAQSELIRAIWAEVCGLVSLSEEEWDRPGFDHTLYHLRATSAQIEILA
jgi:hypothetical protein